MKNDDIAKLKKIIDLLSSIEGGSVGKCYIQPDLSYDESIVIGTNQSLLILAKQLLGLVYNTSVEGLRQDSSKQQKEIINGIEYYCSDSIKNCFSEFSDIWPVCAFIAENDKDAQELLKAIKD